MAGPIGKLSVPLFGQADNRSGEGWRECFTSSCAMLAAFYGRCRSDDDYSRIRARFGDTTSPDAQLLALRSLGLTARFTQRLERLALVAELQRGMPVAVGWLHHGPADSPRGGGHWGVIAGWSPSGPWLLDPWGEPALLTGGHLRGGKPWQGWVSWRNFVARWDCRPTLVDGRNPGPSGWAVLVEPRA